MAFPRQEYWCESESRSVMSDALQRHGLYSPWNSPGQNTGVGSLSLLQGIFPTQRSNPGLPPCRRILYQLNHKGSPVGCHFLLQRILLTQRSNLHLLHCRQYPALQADSLLTMQQGNPQYKLANLHFVKKKLFQRFKWIY